MALVALPEPDRAIMSRREAIVEDLRRLVGAHAVIADEDGRRAYETDALTAYRRLPLAVVLPASTEEVSRVLAYCHQHGIKVVARGAGTSLSGGALPAEDAVVIGVSRMSRVLEIDYMNRIARVEVGITNLGISDAVKAQGLLLRARSLEPARLHARRQHRHELGRRALPQVRRDDQQRARPQDGADGRRGDRDRRRASRFAGLRPPGAGDRLGGPARHRHGGDRAHPAGRRRRAARCCSASIPARPPASASPPSSAPASSPSPSSSWTGRRSMSARPSPRPAIRSRSRRC